VNLFKRCTCADPARCRHPFWFRYRLHRHRYRESTHTANRTLAGRIAEKHRLTTLEGKHGLRRRKAVRLSEQVKTYLKHTAKANRTGYKDRAVLDAFLASVGDRALDEVSPFHVERWKQERAEAVSLSTVNRELNIVRGCFSRAVKWGRLAVSPLHAVQSYKVDDCRIRVLSDDELRLVLSAPPFVALVCRVTLISLSRISEVLALRREHLGGSWMELRRKGGRVHRIALPDDLRTRLLARCHASGYIFGEGPTGEPPSQQTASNRVLRALAALGLSGVTHHTMRHTGVTLMLEAGVNPRAIQTLAGWTTLRMLERYGHARDAEMRRALLANADYLQQVATKTATEGHGDGADSHEPRGGKVIQSE
jgi:integrase